MAGNEKIIDIDIRSVIKLLKNDTRKFCIWCSIAAVIGVIVAFTTPKTYKSTVILAPEESGAGFSGSLSSLASMVGMNMKVGQTGDALYPEIYPDLVQSVDFSVGLFPIKITTKNGDIKCDYYTYQIKHTKTALIEYPMLAVGKILGMIRPKEDNTHKKGSKGENTPLWLTREQEKVVKEILSSVQCNVDKKTSVITITVEDQDPMVAALMADSVKSHLQVAITDYRTKKARNDLYYMEKIFNEARSQYDKARQLYASYADANQDVILQSFKLKKEDLENDMQLKYNIYTQVVEQTQLARSKVQERTPAFTVVQSAIVPTKASSRSRMSVVVIFTLLGSMLRLGVLIWKNKSLFINL